MLQVGGPRSRQCKFAPPPHYESHSRLTLEGRSPVVNQDVIQQAKEHFGKLVEEQLARVERMKQADDWVDFAKLSPIILGVCGGDGIGPYITGEAQRVLEKILEPEVKAGKIEFRTIEGLTIENRAAQLKAIPDDVLLELKKCHVILKGPTTTPQQGDPWPNIESANVSMRRELDLFANVRPVRVPREEHRLDVLPREHGRRLHPRQQGRTRITTTSASTSRSSPLSRAASACCAWPSTTPARPAWTRSRSCTKANIIKLTDGMFLEVARERREGLPGRPVGRLDRRHHVGEAHRPASARPTSRSWRCPTSTATSSPTRPRSFRAASAPPAAPTSASATRCSRQSTAARRAWSTRAAPSTPTPAASSAAAPCCWTTSATRTAASKLDMALDICGQYEKKLVMTGRNTGANGTEYANYVMETYEDPNLESRWRAASGAAA